MSVNRVNITGNLTRDSELRKTASGMSILVFGVAVNDRRKNQSTGEWEDYPNYVDCTLFGNRAEALEPYLNKGVKVAVDGKLHWSQWEDNGVKRSKLQVNVENVDLMSKGSGQGDGSSSNRNCSTQSQQSQTNREQRSTGSYSLYDEDIPF